ncbi:hypothetical protein C7B80_19205 [Cyanosarcina cf. burmensis CCALA 770]|nr:hypothetical protein C7B80_19205 [Cyanosarcina cf. burmensis CCALA 770]
MILFVGSPRSRKDKHHRPVKRIFTYLYFLRTTLLNPLQLQTKKLLAGNVIHLFMRVTKAKQVFLQMSIFEQKLLAFIHL